MDRKLIPGKVNESNDDALGINSLPDEIIEEVFGYLTQNQLGQIARVCRKWNALTKSPVLWKNVNVKLLPLRRCQTTVAESFINGLPSCVTSIRLDFTEFKNWINLLDFKELCLRLQEKCPHLEELILIHSLLSDSLSLIIDFCSKFLQDVKKLIFHSSKFHYGCSTDEYCGISKIKILELVDCHFNCFNKPPFSKMPHLQQLNLFGTNIDDSWFKDDISFLNQLHGLNLGHTEITAETFQAIQNHGLNLKEFYICVNLLQDQDLTFTDSVFPHLETICLADNFITCEGVVSLIQSCKSLLNVYVNEHVSESFAAHPFVVANRCKSGIVKVIDWNHNHHVIY